MALFSVKLIGVVATIGFISACMPAGKHEGQQQPVTPVGDAPPAVDVPAAPTTPLTLHAETFDTDTMLPRVLASDATHLYWGTEGGQVWRVFKGKQAATLVASDSRAPTELVIADAFVFWSVLGGEGGGAILRVAKTGGTVTELARGEIVDIALDDETLYWVARHPDDDGFDVMSQPIAGWAVTTALTTRPLEPGGDVTFAFSPTTIYWSMSHYDGQHNLVELFAMDKHGGEPRLVTRSSDSWTLDGSLASDDDRVLWLDLARSLRSVAVDGGAVSEVDASLRFETFALSDRGVLAVPTYQNRIVRYAAAGGPGELAYETTSPPALMLVDGDSVYWAEWTSECTEERFEGKSAWCAAYEYQLQLVRAAK